jgi:hypothetical protein
MTNIRVTVAKSVVRVTSADGSQVRVTNSQGSSVRVSSLGLQGIPGTRIVEMGLSINGTIPLNTLLRRYIATGAISFDPDNAVALLGTSTVADMVLPIKDDQGNVVGNISFLAGQTSGTVTMTQTDYVRGDVLDFFGPVSANPATNILAVTLPATR